MGYKSLIIFLIIGAATTSCAQTTFDPLSLSIGARALGLGKAYVAVAEDGDTIFNNPAGLGIIDTFKFTSMGGNLLEDVTYTVLGGVYPLGEQSAVGVGFAGSFISGIEVRDSIGNLLRKANYSNSVLIASFGKKFGDRTSLGLSLKYFFNKASEINDGDGSGWNLDLGILQSDLGWLSLGLVGQNLISSSKIIYQNGESENLPLTIKGGAKMYLLGSRYQSAVYSPVELVAAVDVEQILGKANLLALHSGLEFSPNPILTLRAGSDQGSTTLGLSLKFGGLGFHYAYQPLAQYFSISFDERGWPPEEKPDAYIGQK